MLIKVKVRRAWVALGGVIRGHHSLTLAPSLTPPPGNPFTSPPQTLTGKEIEIDIEPADSVARIKERVEEKEGIPPAQQR